ncbi:MAG: hypothetical protein IK130_09010 [Oscillospiraceae bacterium]|nr:hypothetical protein [Oscillospiraceae bacterium]
MDTQTRILNIHGYHGSAQNAAFGALTANGFTRITAPQIDYDACTPDAVCDMLRGIIREQQIGLLTGTSYGGFFAAVLAAESGLPAIFVNPCLMPFLHLPRLGYMGDIRAFLPLFASLGDLDSRRVSCIVGADDEIIDTHDFTERLLGNARFRRIPGGKHSGATLPLPDYFGEILRAM